jgi:hypothetical protein
MGTNTRRLLATLVLSADLVAAGAVGCAAAPDILALRRRTAATLTPAIQGRGSSAPAL